jgi:hypothetical protein
MHPLSAPIPLDLPASVRLHPERQIGHSAPIPNRVKFDIYCRKGGRLINLLRINRTPTGLYFNAPHDPMRARGGRSGPCSTFSYHESGRSWFKQGTDRSWLKRLEIPLSAFRGARTIQTGQCFITDGGISPLESSVHVRPNDIIIDRTGPFGVEIILSDQPLILDPDPKRPNSEIHTFDRVFPVILVEVFDLREGGALARFPRMDPLVEGVNLFFDHRGRI